MKMTIVQDVVPFSLTESDQRFRDEGRGKNCESTSVRRHDTIPEKGHLQFLPVISYGHETVSHIMGKKYR
jgi:hypothetical protein